QGESVAAGQPIIIVSRGGELEVSVGIPADMVSAVKVGTKVSIEVSALGDKRLPGTVREVSFVSESSTYPARVAFDEALDVLRPGMAAAATFDLGSKVAELSVPASAVANLEEGSFVFVLEPAEGDTFTVTRRSIILGALIGESFEIEKGIAVGERVAAAGLSSLVDGMKVKLIDSPDKSAPKEAASKPSPGDKVGKPDSEVATPKAPEGVE
ncbi:MAG: efflux RND transporter periplasmic adaptor subunit, partial [Kofleriaceae bacterium]|nr:efflux RND transporter periplasmic adaptor subunit [Kofleriaceae bacterium]